jgi:capsular polysaccharide biosynthesis protein/MinD-like ATPase involved in chromosome partitioning or flagellar assembly
MELATYIEIILRRKKIILGIFLFLLVLIVLVSLIIPPKYASSVSLRVLTPRSGGMNYVNFDIYYANRLMNTYVSLASSNSVLDEVKKSLKLTEISDVEAEIIPDTELVKITVKDRNSGMAVQIANAIANQLLSRNSEISREANSAAENSLNDQINKKKEQLSQAKNDYKALINPNSQTNSRITSLQNQIQSDQALYVTLYDRYEVGRQGVIDPATTSSQSAALSSLKAQIDEEKSTLEILNIKASDDSEQIRSSLRDVTLLEQEYLSLVTQLDQVRALQTIQGSTETLIIVEHATPATKPASPNYLLVYSIGFVLSLFLAILVAFIIDNMDPNLFSSDQIQALTHIPLLGRIRKIKKDPDSDEESSEYDFTCDAQINLRPIIQNKAIRSVILSGLYNECNSSLHSVNLGRAFAESGINTVLLDANLDTPSVHSLFPKISNVNGLSQVLAGKIELDKAIKESGLENLSILPAGKTGGVIGSQELKEIIQQLIQIYSMVVVNISPVDTGSDTVNLISCVDGIILLLNLDKMKKNDLKSFITRYLQLNPSIIGFLDYQEDSLAAPSIPIKELEREEIPVKQFSYQKKLKLAFSQLTRNSLNEE